LVLRGWSAFRRSSIGGKLRLAEKSDTREGH